MWRVVFRGPGAGDLGGCTTKVLGKRAPRGTHRQMPRHGVGGGGGASGLFNTILPKATFLVFDGANEFQLTIKARFNVGES